MQGRYARTPEQAAQSHSLHPVIDVHCGDDHRRIHLLETTDHDYSSVSLHVNPLVSEIEKVMQDCPSFGRHLISRDLSSNSASANY